MADIKTSESLKAKTSNPPKGNGPDPNAAMAADASRARTPEAPQAKTAEAPKAKTSRPPKTSRSRRRLVVIALAAVVILGGAGVTAFWATYHTAGEATTPRPAEQGLISLEPFVVNLADQGGSRFLRVSVRLIVESVEQAERVQKSNVMLTRARSAILELLTQQTADQLITAEGKSALKAAIGKKLEPVLEETKVVDVLFSDFVVQF